MKTKHFAKGLLFGASLLLASAAFAGEKASIKLYEDVKVSGKTLTLDARFGREGTGANVQLSIVKAKTPLPRFPRSSKIPRPRLQAPAIDQEGRWRFKVVDQRLLRKKYSSTLTSKQPLLPRPQFPLQVTSNFASFLYTVCGHTVPANAPSSHVSACEDVLPVSWIRPAALPLVGRARRRH
jgi:hypothetical protein